MASDSQGPAIGEVVSLVRGNTYKSALLGQAGPVLLGLGTIERNGGFRTDSLKTYGGKSSEKILLRPGDLYVSLKDVTQSADLLGAIARLPESVPLGRLTQDTVKLDFTGAPYSKSLLYWTLRTPQYRAFCRDYATGTTTLGLAREDFLGYRLPAPDRNTLCLVELLEALQSRIELLQQTNATLEAIARAPFKSWFVDFDPVHAKAEGREPEGMDTATAALFPSEFEDSELGPIPKGWRVEQIGSLVDCLGGATPSTKNAAFWEEGIHQWATPKDLSALRSPVLLDTARKVTDAGLAKISSGLLPAGTLLLSSRAPIGYLAIAAIPTAINQGFIAMPPGGELSPVFLLCWCKQNMDLIHQSANGSTFMEISKKAFRPLPVSVPTAEIRDAFDQLAIPIIDKITANEQHRRSLTELRATLLPCLISGKLGFDAVKDALRKKRPLSPRCGLPI
ncbi:MAG: restriction endonuclease subunit S [Kiritimatiellae bacterium]|nr:restriction endonuclease subunit S [Kiritimatiellia bacterium]